MKVLVGISTNGWHRTGLVARFSERHVSTMVTTPSIEAMVDHLRALGIPREAVILAGEDDGDRAMSTHEQHTFWEAWNTGRAP